jgi:hypothetical protein
LQYSQRNHQTPINLGFPTDRHRERYIEREQRPRDRNPKRDTAPHWGKAARLFKCESFLFAFTKPSPKPCKAPCLLMPSPKRSHNARQKGEGGVGLEAPKKGGAHSPIPKFFSKTFLNPGSIKLCYRVLAPCRGNTTWCMI